MTDDELRAWRSSIRVGARVARGSGWTFWMGTVIDGPVLYDHWWAQGTRRWRVDFDLPEEDGEPDIRLMPDKFLYPPPYPDARDVVSLYQGERSRPRRRSRPADQKAQA